VCRPLGKLMAGASGDVGLEAPTMREEIKIFLGAWELGRGVSRSGEMELNSKQRKPCSARKVDVENSFQKLLPNTNIKIILCVE
jgi:hypothetical protein